MPLEFTIAYHQGKIKLQAKRGISFRNESFMGIMRWTFFERLKMAHPEIPVKITYGYLTKTKRIIHSIEKTHCADAYPIAGNPEAKRLGSCFAQRQTRKHNRQIHKLNILKGGVRKLNQAPYETKEFRLFDKVSYQGKEGFIFGRRSTGHFDIRALEGVRISASINCKKLHLIETKRTFLIQP